MIMCVYKKRLCMHDHVCVKHTHRHVHSLTYMYTHIVACVLIYRSIEATHTQKDDVYACMHVCMYVCMYVCIYIYTMSVYKQNLYTHTHTNLY
jgi:hypothetical protein